jgi:hypothetical protein
VEPAFVAQSGDGHDGAAHPVVSMVPPCFRGRPIGMPRLVQGAGQGRDPRVAPRLHPHPGPDLASGVGRGKHCGHLRSQVFSFVDVRDQR